MCVCVHMCITMSAWDKLTPEAGCTHVAYPYVHTWVYGGNGARTLRSSLSCDLSLGTPHSYPTSVVRLSDDFHNALAPIYKGFIFILSGFPPVKWHLGSMMWSRDALHGTVAAWIIPVFISEENSRLDLPYNLQKSGMRQKSKCHISISMITSSGKLGSLHALSDLKELSIFGK